MRRAADAALPWELPVTVILVAVIYIGQQVYDGLFVRDNVSNLSHIVGGLVGLAAAPWWAILGAGAAAYGFDVKFEIVKDDGSSTDVM